MGRLYGEIAPAMFDRIKKVFSRHAWPTAADSSADAGRFAYAPVSQWAATQGFAFADGRARQAFSVTGRVADKRWRLELGPPSRSYILGEELRARADLGDDSELAVLVMSRGLKEMLQKQADQLPQHAPQAHSQRPLGEELRWLSQYPEVDWIGPSLQFWSRFAVMAGAREQAVEWLGADLVRQLMSWPLPGASHEVPFVLLLLHGKVYLRMEYRPADLPTLQHAAAIFTTACEGAAVMLAQSAGAQGQAPRAGSVTH